MDNTPNPRVLRRELMARRDAALAAGDIAQYQSLTTQIAALPMPGIPVLTKKDIERWNARNGN